MASAIVLDQASTLQADGQLVGLAGPTFLLRFSERSGPRIVVEVPSDIDQGRLTSWLDSHPTMRFSTDQEEFRDSTIWKFVNRSAASRPTRLTPAPTPPRVAPSLDFTILKQSRVGAIDAKTHALINQGFIVDGKTFSASETAQLKWLGLFTAKATVTYPITVPTMDNAAFVSLVDANDVTTYYTAIVNHVQAVLSAGIALKAQIAAAADQTALDAIVDNRT